MDIGNLMIMICADIVKSALRPSSSAMSRKRFKYASIIDTQFHRSYQ
jgi:hypothetical protein